MRYLILVASVLIQVCIGGLYAWTLFAKVLADNYGWSRTQTQLPFGVLIATFTVAMIFAGRLLGRRGPRVVALAGGVMFAGGYLVSGLSGGSFPVLLLGMGVVTGIGTGFCYVCPLTMCAAWFPKHKGLITGIAVAGFGGGAIVMTWLAETLLHHGMDVLAVFRWIALIYGTVIVLAALPLAFPPRRVATGRKPPLAVGRVIRDGFFWMLWAALFAGTFGGLLVIGSLKDIGAWIGIATGAADLAIGTFALGNAVGRISWGFIADRLGSRSVPLSLLALALAMTVLVVLPANGPLFVLLSGLVGFGFGACFVVYAEQVGSHYGIENLASIYPLVFLAYGLSGIAGPAVGGALYDWTQSYTASILVGAGVVAAGLVLTARLLRRRSA